MLLRTVPLAFVLVVLPACEEPRPTPGSGPPDAAIAAAKQAQGDALKELAAASEVLGQAAAATQAALGKQVEATERRALAARHKAAALEPARKNAVAEPLAEVSRRGDAAKRSIATLETTTGAQLQEARSEAQAAAKAFESATVELEKALAP